MEQPGPYGAGRMSSQRRAIATVVSETDRVFSVDALAERLDALGYDIGLATVYRAVSAMRESGFIERIDAQEGTELYARCDTTHHHHHMVCTECGRVMDAPCPVGSEAERLARQRGFTVTGHSLTLYGNCAECGPGADGNASPPAGKVCP